MKIGTFPAPAALPSATAAESPSASRPPPDHLVGPKTPRSQRPSVRPAPATEPSPVRVSVPSGPWWRRAAARVTAWRLGAALTFVAALTAAWVWTPLSDLSDVDQVSRMLEPLRGPWWGPMFTVVAVALAALAFVPLTPMVLAAVLAFGTVKAFFVVFAAAMLNAVAGHSIGRFGLGDGLRARLDRRVPLIAEQLDHDLRTTLLMRLVPVAPFTLVNLVAGSGGLRLGHFMLGTFLGVIPNLALLVWASDNVLEAIRNPSWMHLAKGAGAVTAVVLVSLGIRRLMRRRADHWRASAAPPAPGDTRGNRAP